MILAIDIGNSNINFGGFCGDELAFSARISTSSSMTEDEYAVLFSNVLKIKSVDSAKIDGAIISSVVPPLNSVIRRAVTELFKVQPIFVGPGVKTGIAINCDVPSSVGADLICASVAAYGIYKSPCLIIDMGTATKMIAVNEHGAFVGVSIIPGVMMGLDALAERTAQLPKICLEVPPSVIAKNTVDSMRSGVLYGNASMIDGMIDRIKDEMRSDIAVVATGGFAETVIPHCRYTITVDEHLVLKGLNILYSKNTR